MKKSWTGIVSVRPSFAVVITLAIGIGLLTGCGNNENPAQNLSSGAPNTNARAPRALEPVKNITVTIGADSATFGTNPLVITKGTSVTWVNSDSKAHTATSTTGAFDSGTLTPNGGTYSYTFSRPGNYPYRSTVDGDQMTGAVRVTSDRAADDVGNDSGSPDPTISVDPTDPSDPGLMPTHSNKCRECQQQKPIIKPTVRPKPIQKPTPRPLPTLY